MHKSIRYWTLINNVIAVKFTFTDSTCQRTILLNGLIANCRQRRGTIACIAWTSNRITVRTWNISIHLKKCTATKVAARFSKIRVCCAIIWKLIQIQINIVVNLKACHLSERQACWYYLAIHNRLVTERTTTYWDKLTWTAYILNAHLKLFKNCI